MLIGLWIIAVAQSILGWPSSIFEKTQRLMPFDSSFILRFAAMRVGIKQSITCYVIRHSFATHLLESGVDLRQIQVLLGHGSSKTTEIYTHVATNTFKDIKNPLD